MRAFYFLCGRRQCCLSQRQKKGSLRFEKNFILYALIPVAVTRSWCLLITAMQSCLHCYATLKIWLLKTGFVCCGPKCLSYTEWSTRLVGLVRWGVYPCATPSAGYQSRDDWQWYILLQSSLAQLSGFTFFSCTLRMEMTRPLGSSSLVRLTWLSWV